MSGTDGKDGGKSPGSSGRRRKAARPPTIDLEAREVKEPEGPGASRTAKGADTEKAQARGKTEAASRATGGAARSETRKAPKTESREPPKAGSGGTEGAAKESAKQTRGAERTGAAGEARKPEAGAQAGAFARERRGRGTAVPGTAQLMMAAGAGAAISLVAFVAFQLIARGDNEELSASLGRLTAKMDSFEQQLAGRGSGAAVEARLADLASRTEAARERSSALSARLDALDERLASGADGGPAAAALAGRIGKIEKKLDGLAPRVAQALSGLGDLNAALESASAGDGEGAAGAQQVRIEALAARTGRLETGIEDIAATAKAAEAAAKRLAARVSALSEWREREAAARSERGGEIEKLRARLEALAPRLERMETAVREAARVDISALEAAEKRLAEKLAAVDERLAQATAARGGLLGAALGALEQAAAAGRPFKRELDAVRALVPGLAPPAALEAHAGSGIPSLAGLVAALEEAEANIAALPAADDGGLMRRLMRSAGNVVTVRRDGETVLGRARPAPIAAIAAALESGDLDAAIAAAERPDGEAEAALAGWLAKAKARREALRLAAAFAGEARARIGPEATAAEPPPAAPGAGEASGSGTASGGAGG